MSSRRILISATLLGVCLLVASLGLMVHGQEERDARPAQLEVVKEVEASLEAMTGDIVGLETAPDLDAARAARQELARRILAFDQDLVALAASLRDEAAVASLGEVRGIWRVFGLDLADLAAGEFAPSSAAGREVMSSFPDRSHRMRAHLESTAAALRQADRRATELAASARTAAVVIGGLTVLLGLIAVWPRGSSDAVTERDVHRPDEAVPELDDDLPASPRPTPPRDGSSDLGQARASVDRVSVDMLTVARSAERMQQAVDSVAAALHGMLANLDEMARDTQDGARIVRTAHNAATCVADTARELLATTGEMSEVVGRVRALAARSREVAGRIEAEAATVGPIGEAFTRVVAQEVEQLAGETDQSTAGIEAVVEEILARQRDYEQSIGQIVENVGAVRKVAAHLGELMLEPVPETGATLDPEPALASAASSDEPVAAEPAVEDEGMDAPELTAGPAGATGSVFMLNRPRAATDEAPSVEPTVEPEVAREPEAASGPDVMLEPEAIAVEPPPEPEAIAGSGGDEAGDPVEETSPSTAEEEAQPVLAGAPAARPVGQGASGNIFMLNKVK